MKTQTKEDLDNEQITCYLPFRVKIQGQTNLEIQEISGIRGDIIYTKEGNPRYGWADIADIKLILHPFSDFEKDFKEIFIGAYSSRDNIYLTTMSKKGNQFIEWSNDNGWALVTAKGNVQIYKDHELIAPYRIMKEFFKRHLDFQGLIEKGLAISYNDLDN